MRFTAALFGSASFLALAVPTVLAVPRPSSANHARRTTYSTTWAGAIWDESDGTFTSVTGTFTVPTVSGSAGDSASAWVGIDGDTCSNAMFYTGVDLIVGNDGESQYDVWYGWHPDYEHDFSGIDVAAGDVVKLTVTSSSSTSGTATVENLTNGQTVSQDLTSSSALCGRNAEWIVEGHAVDNGGQGPLANFGTVTFTDAKATGGSGTTYTPSGATITDIEQNNQVMTSTSVDESSVTVKYVG